MANKKFIPRPKESAKVIKKRWSKKRESIETLANNIQRLRYNVSTDLKSDNEKIALTALVVAIMDKTAERVGNEESASNGHVGITGLRKTQVNVIGNKVILEYTGKSGVEHEKMFSDERIAKALKQAKKNSKTKYVFTTSDGFKIKADRINRYLSDFDITAKDIRGYSANKWAVTKLNEVTPEETEHKRKRQFNSIIRRIANKVGHGIATLKKHYLIPELEPNFIKHGKVIDINDIKKFNGGGMVDKSIKKTDKILLAPNGKPSNLSSEQYRIVRTPQFKEWFGDWENESNKSSKVVDENGEPLVVYHSFPNENISGEINDWHNKKFIFDPKKEGFEMLHKRRKNGGIYFSSSKEVSKQYGDNTFEFFLNFKNPVILNGNGKNISLLDDKIYKSEDNDVIIKNVNDEIFEPIPSDIFITSNPNAIKLADGSNVIFNKNNPDVRMKNGGEFNLKEENGVLRKGGEAKNPYAICTTSIAKAEGTTNRSKWDDDAMERYESCVLKVKDKKSEGGTLTIKNKKVYEGDKKLRDMNYQEATKYMGFYLEKEGNMFFRKGFFLIWFYDTTDFIQKINSQEWDFLFFPPMTERMVLSAGYGIVDSIWKRNFQKRNKGAENLLGMLQGWYDNENKKIYIQYMSVRPSAKRNRINTFMVKEAKNQFGTNDVFFAEPTKDGIAFKNANTYDNGGNIKLKKLPMHYIKVIHDESKDYIGAIKFNPNNTERSDNLANLIYLSKKAGYRFVPISQEEYEKIISKIDYEKLKKFQDDVDLVRNNENVKKFGGETNSDKNSEELFGLDKAKNLSEFDSNIEKIVSQYAHRKMAALQVESYLNENKDFAKQWLKDKSINSRDELAEYTNKLQSKLRAGVRKERSQSKADYHVDRIFSLAHQQEKEWQERIDKSDKDEMSKGGELTDDEKSDIYSEWRELINMSASELEKFMNTEEGREAGLSKEEADELGIKSGRESARWIIKMKKTPNKDWTPTMWDWAKRQLRFVKRMRGNKGDLFDDKGNKTKKHTSLLIWGHNPKK